jgi:hypothetical protein
MDVRSGLSLHQTLTLALSHKGRGKQLRTEPYVASAAGVATSRARTLAV